MSLDYQDAISLDQVQELMATQDQGHAAQLEGRLRDLHTCLPGIVQSYDAAAQTVTVQPVLQRLFLTGGSPGWNALPLCVDVPVQFPAGGGGVLTFPLAAGDECLLLFSERGLDNWWQAGGVQQPAGTRMHDLSDAVALVGLSSQPRAIPDVSTTATELRTRDGAVRLSLDATGITVTGTLTVTGDVLVGPGKLSTEKHVHPFGGAPPQLTQGPENLPS